MKRKTVSLILIICMIGSLVGCGEEKSSQSKQNNSLVQENEKQEENVEQESEVISSSGPLYDDSNLDIVDDEKFESFQGKIEDIYIDGLHMLLYVDGVVYEDTFDENWEPIWKEWNTGIIKSIVLFDYENLVVEKPDNSLYVYNETIENEECVLRELKLDCTKEEFMLGNSYDHYYIYVYQRDNVTYAYKYDYLDNTTTEKELIMESNYLLGVEDSYSDIVVMNKKGIVNSSNIFYETSTPMGTTSEWRCGFYTHTSVENIDTYYGANSSGKEHVFKLKEDNNNLLWVKNPLVSTNEQLRINMPLPDGYTTEDIRNVYIDRDIIVEFNDNAYYIVENMSSMEIGDEIVFEKIENMESIIPNMIKIQPEDYDVYILMNDGYLYEY